MSHASPLTDKPKHTPGHWYVGAQNDALYVTAGRSPSLSNDYPWHDAPRVAVARVFDAGSTDALPVDATANAHLLAAAPDLLAALENLADFCDMVFVKPRECDDLIAARAAIRLALTGERA